MLNLFSRNAPKPLASSLCRQQDFDAAWYNQWKDRIAAGAPDLDIGKQAVWAPVWAGMQGKWMHRKLWEWCAIAQALEERGMLAPGKSGMGFAVGEEPLPSLFAARGADVIASDLADPAGTNLWASTGQLATSLEAIRWQGLIGAKEFAQRVRYMSADMRDLSSLPRCNLDFLWSSCAFEHLGSLASGLQFVEDAMECLRPGGIAVHTTEYNVSSNDETVEDGDSVIYRQKDIEAFARRLRLRDCAIEGLDFDPGSEQHDIAFDFPPYYKQGREHVKLNLLGHISTSLLLIIRKAL